MKRRRRTLDAEPQDAGAGDIIFFVSFLYSCLIMSGIKFTNFAGARSEQFPTFDACEEWALSLEHNVMVDKPEKHKHIKFCMRCQTRHRFGHHVVYKR